MAKLSFIAGFCAAALLCGTAQAVVVLPNTTWSTNYPSENSGGGSSTITSSVARSGNGSVEMFGDRTRFSMGDYYNPASNLGLLSTVLGIAFDWRVASDSSGGYSPDLTPALRIHIYDNGKRSELIWEGAYNNTYGNTTRDTWYTTTFSDLFYQNVAGPGGGVTLQGGSQVNQTVVAWEGSYSAAAYVSAISVGVGSGFSSTYHAFADNVAFGQTGGTTTYNFEVAATAVPEPASLVILGAGMIGLGLLRRRNQTSS